MSIHQGDLSIRLVRNIDTQQLLDIYAPFVKNTAVSFEYEVPTLPLFWDRIAEVLAYCPWLVCELNGKIAGYAYAGTHRKRVAYQWSVELSVYVNADYQRLGVARGLYTALIALLRLQGYKNALAIITIPNEPSEHFHAMMGFHRIGIYQKIGFKLGRWHDVEWWQLRLDETNQPPFVLKTPAELQGTIAWENALQMGIACLKI